MAVESHRNTTTDMTRREVSEKPLATVVRIGGGDHQRDYGGGTDDRLARSAIPARSK